MTFAAPITLQEAGGVSMFEDADERARARANEAMERYADGEDAAFSALYDELAPRLLRFASVLTGSESAAEDVTQQTLLQIHGSRARFVRGAPVLPWAYAIARNLVRDESRKRANELRLAEGARPEERSADARPDEALETKWRWRAVAEALKALPEKLRVTVLLVNVEGLSVAEAAEALGVTCGNVKVRVHRARQLLRAGWEGAD